MTISLQPPSTDQGGVRCELEFHGVRFRMAFNRNFPTQRYICDQVMAGICYEAEATAALIAELKAGETFFDVGANCGWFSALACAMGARVVAFEPDPMNAEALFQNAPDAQCWHVALTDKAGETQLYVNLDNDGGHALWPCGIHPFNARTAAAGNPTMKIFGARLDNWAQENPTVIKIDTEGAECNVLLGAENILSNPSLRMVICERNETGLDLMGHSPEEIESIMRRYGFRWEEPKGDIVSNWIFRR